MHSWLKCWYNCSQHCVIVFKAFISYYLPQPWNKQNLFRSSAGKPNIFANGSLHLTQITNIFHTITSIQQPEIYFHKYWCYNMYGILLHKSTYRTISNLVTVNYHVFLAREISCQLFCHSLRPLRTIFPCLVGEYVMYRYLRIKKILHDIRTFRNYEKLPEAYIKSKNTITLDRKACVTDKS